MGLYLQQIIETVSKTEFELYKLQSMCSNFTNYNQHAILRGGSGGGGGVPALLARGVPILLESSVHRFRARLDHFALHGEEYGADKPVVRRQGPHLPRKSSQFKNNYFAEM